MTKIKSSIKKYRQLIIVFIGIILLTIFEKHIIGTIDKLIFLYLFIAIAFNIDGRIPLGGGIVLLLGTALLVGTNENIANQFTKNAYYLLVIGVIQLFIKHITEKEKEDIQAINEPMIDRKYHTIAIASGKGGVGKTTIAANLGIMLSRLGKKVTVIDMDLAMPDLEILTGLKNPPVGLVDAIEGRLEFKKITYVGPEGVKLIPPGIMLEGYSKEETREKIKNLFKNLPTDNDYIILDMPPGREAVDVLSDGEIGTLLVVNVDKPSILDAINMKALLEQKGVKTLGVILNRHERDLEVIDEIEKAIDTKVVAVIPDSNIVKNAYHNEELFVITNPDSLPSKELMDLAKEIVGN